MNKSTPWCVSQFRELLTYIMEDPRNITFRIHLLFSAKNIERTGDHILGGPIISERPKGDSTSFAALAV